MKTLVIVRHAKAENLPLNKTDYERKLTTRGKEDAEKMALQLTKQIKCPEIFIASPAKRSWSTAKRFAKAFNIREENIASEKNIYNAHADTLIEIVQTIDNNFKSAVLFGHNPGFSQMACFFSGESNIELPTCGVVILEFNIKEWYEADYNKGKIISFQYP